MSRPKDSDPYFIQLFATDEAEASRSDSYPGRIEYLRSVAMAGMIQDGGNLSAIFGAFTMFLGHNIYVQGVGMLGIAAGGAAAKGAGDRKAELTDLRQAEIDNYRKEFPDSPGLA